MALPDDARDPWGALAAVFVAGLAWAVGVDVVEAAAIGGAAFVVKLGADSVLGRRRRGPATLAPPPRNSVAGQLLARAENAVRSIRQQAETVAPGPSHDQLASAVAGASSALDGMRRLASQAAVMDDALARIDRPRLTAEEDRLSSAAETRGASGDVREEITRSLASVREQIAVADRLDAARQSLLARAQTATLGLEGLVARVVEVVALTATAGGVDTVSAKISDLSSELEGLRAGLAETEALSRRAISGSAAAADPPTEPGPTEGRGA